MPQSPNRVIEGEFIVATYPDGKVVRRRVRALPLGPTMSREAALAILAPKSEDKVRA